MSKKMQAGIMGLIVFVLIAVAVVASAASATDDSLLDEYECKIQEEIATPVLLSMVCEAEEVDDAEYGVVYVQAPHMPIAD